MSVPPADINTTDLPECCRTGYVMSGTPTGSEAKLGGIETYVVRPEQPTDKAIIIFTDAFGWTFHNTRLLASAFAKETGFNVFVPDLMAGEAIQLEAVIGPDQQIVAKAWAGWREKNGDEKAVPLMNKFIEAIKDPNGLEKIKRIGGVGYCWGGRYAVMAGINNQIDVVATAHPSFLDVPAQIEQLRKPTLLLCAETDAIFPYETMALATKAILEKNGVHHEFHFYPGTQHGFAVRGDENNEVHEKSKKHATATTIKFFKGQL